MISAKELKKYLDRWIIDYGINLKRARCEADLVNHDYQGWRFDHIFLIGDAAGLASPLTGEGINPAITSGEAAARAIIDSSYKAVDLERVISKHRAHWKMVRLAGGSRIRSLLLSEICAYGLKRGLIGFEKFEMA
jgi:geranylgeranyl reductase